MSDKQAKMNAEIVRQFLGDGYWKYPWVLAVRRHIRALEAENVMLKAALSKLKEGKDGL